MPSEPIISLRGVGKRYNLYDKPKDRLKQMVANWLPGSADRKFYRGHWALRGVDLDIARGETVGIIGQNGSGKSTLLQLICGTLTPTEGEVRVQGRIAPLLQLGAGFNPEFTGRENVMLNATILGLSEEEIEARFDDIVAFADIGEMLEQPVKLYSSGMYLRLAFAVAINVDPEILVVDEALAVGDDGFQRKCYARIEAIRRAGATVLFVSHVAATVQELCSRAVLLDKGEVLEIGSPKNVLLSYHRLVRALDRREEERARIKAGKPHIETPATSEETFEASAVKTGFETFDPSLVPASTQIYPSHGARIRNVIIHDSSGRQVNLLKRNTPYWYDCEVEFEQECRAVRFSMLVKTVSGLALGAQWSAPHGEALDIVPQGMTMRVQFPINLPFAAGVYFGNAGVSGIPRGRAESIVLHRVVDAIMFRVAPIAADRMSSHVDITGGLPAQINAIESADGSNAERQGDLAELAAKTTMKGLI